MGRIGYREGEAGWGYSSQGRKAHSGSTTLYGAQYSSGDEITCEVNLDRGTLQFFKNGQDQGVAATDLKGPLTPALTVYKGSKPTLGTLTSFM